MHLYAYLTTALSVVTTAAVAQHFHIGIYESPNHCDGKPDIYGYPKLNECKETTNVITQTLQTGAIYVLTQIQVPRRFKIHPHPDPKDHNYALEIYDNEICSGAPIKAYPVPESGEPQCRKAHRCHGYKIVQLD